MENEQPSVIINPTPILTPNVKGTMTISGTSTYAIGNLLTSSASLLPKKQKYIFKWSTWKKTIKWIDVIDNEKGIPTKVEKESVIKGRFPVAILGIRIWYRYGVESSYYDHPMKIPPELKAILVKKYKCPEQPAK